MTLVQVKEPRLVMTLWTVTSCSIAVSTMARSAAVHRLLASTVHGRLQRLGALFEAAAVDLRQVGFGGFSAYARARQLTLDLLH